MVKCPKCESENPPYSTICRNCGARLIDKRFVQILLVALFIGVLFIAGYWGTPGTFVGGVIMGTILIYIGVKVAKIESGTLLEAFEAALIGTILVLLFGKVYGPSVIIAFVLVAGVIKFVYNTSWKKAVVAWIIYFVIMFIFFAASVIIAIIVYGWASQFTAEEIIQEPDTEPGGVEQLLLESQHLQSDGRLEVCILNAQSRDALIDAEYKNDKLVAGAVKQRIHGHDITCFTLTGTYSVGDRVKLVTQKGTLIVFRVKG
jgi:hypothetical protein